MAFHFLHHCMQENHALQFYKKLRERYGLEINFQSHSICWLVQSDAQVEAAARSCGDTLHRYVFMSSVAAYRPGLDLRESATLVPDDHPNPYAQHKASSERALFRLHADSGFPVTTFRPPFVHGPRQPFYREQFFWDRLRDGRPIILPDGGDAPMQWVFVSDLAEACVRAIEVPEAAGEAFNVAHVEALTQRSFVEALARVAGVARRSRRSRATIQAAGGNPFMGNLYFGEYLDLPPYTASSRKLRVCWARRPPASRLRSPRGSRGTRRSRAVRSTTRSRIACWIRARSRSGIGC